MTTPTTQGATMTLPPCPIAGHDNPHHWHDALYPGVEQVCRPPHNYSDTDSGCLEDDPDVSRCYSAHVPEPDPDEWVRVPVGTVLPPETAVLTEYVTRESTRVMAGYIPFYVTRSDLDAILKPAPTPAPTPAEKLAEALTQLVIGAEDAWLPDDVQSALDAAGLTLAERGEK